MFRSVSYEDDLKGSVILNQALSKMPKDMKESCSSFTVKRNWCFPNLLDFKEWLKEKAETHERMKTFPGTSKTEEPVKTKTPTRVFAFSAKPNKFEYPSCPQCAGKNPFWGCKVFKEKNPAQRVKFSAEKKLCFSCLEADLMFRSCPKSRKCTKPECKSTHTILLHGADRIFHPRKEDNKSSTAKNSSG